MYHHQSHEGDPVLDEVLVEASKQGNKRAFSFLVSRYQNRVINLIFRFVKDIDTAYDLAQDTFIRAYRAIDTFRGDSAFYTWLYRIAVNTAKNHLKKNSKHDVTPDVDKLTSKTEQNEPLAVLRDEASPESVVLSEEVYRMIIKTVEELPDDLKMAITLREIEGLSYTEIADLMSCPVGTVRSRIFRAREAIADSINLT